MAPRAPDTHVQLRLSMLENTPWDNELGFVWFEPEDSGHQVGYGPRELVNILDPTVFSKPGFGPETNWVYDTTANGTFRPQCAALHALRSLCDVYGHDAATEVVECGGLRTIVECMRWLIAHEAADFSLALSAGTIAHSTPWWVEEGSAWLSVALSVVCALWWVMGYHDEDEVTTSVLRANDGLNVVCRYADYYNFLDGARWIQTEAMFIFKKMQRQDKLPPYDDDCAAILPQEILLLTNLAITYVATDLGDGRRGHNESEGLRCALEILEYLAHAERYFVQGGLCNEALTSPRCFGALAAAEKFKCSAAEHLDPLRAIMSAAWGF